MVVKLLAVCHCHMSGSGILPCWSGLLMTLIDACWTVWSLEWGKGDCVDGEWGCGCSVFNWLFICLFYKFTPFLKPRCQCEEWACVSLDNKPVAFVLHSRTICVCVHKLWIWCVLTLPQLRYSGTFLKNTQDFYFCWLWSTSPAKCIMCVTGSQVGRENIQ